MSFSSNRHWCSLFQELMDLGPPSPAAGLRRWRAARRAPLRFADQQPAAVDRRAAKSNSASPPRQ